MTQTSTDSAEAKKPKPTRVSEIRKMLEGRRGATLEALCAATGWQKHSVRAALSGLRKQGYEIARSKAAGDEGGTSYRIVARPGDPE